MNEDDDEQMQRTLSKTSLFVFCWLLKVVFSSFCVFYSSTSRERTNIFLKDYDEMNGEVAKRLLGLPLCRYCQSLFLESRLESVLKVFILKYCFCDWLVIGNYAVVK